MIHLIYDGSFEGLLSTIDLAISEGLAPEKIGKAGNFQTNFLARTIVVTTATARIENLSLMLSRKGLKNLLDDFRKLFLARPPAFELFLLNILKQHLQEEETKEPAVLSRFERLIKKFDKAVAQLESSIRFREEKGYLFFASIAPDFDALPLLADKLAHKYPHAWVIYDSKRKYGMEYDLEKVSPIYLG